MKFSMFNYCKMHFNIAHGKIICVHKIAGFFFGPPLILGRLYPTHFKPKWRSVNNSKGLNERLVRPIELLMLKVTKERLNLSCPSSPCPKPRNKLGLLEGMLSLLIRLTLCF